MNYFNCSHIRGTTKHLKNCGSEEAKERKQLEDPSVSLTRGAIYHRNTQMTTTPNRNSSREFCHYGCHMLSIINPNVVLFVKTASLPPSRTVDAGSMPPLK